MAPAALRSAALLLGVAWLAGCTQLFLHPSREQVLHPQKLGLAWEDVFLPDGHGNRLHGWYLPAQVPEGGAARGTVLHLHGNAENISTFIAAVHWLPAQGYNVFLLDYGGYGRSGGTATVRNVHVDARVALDWLLSRPGADSERLVVFGQSLGGSVAIHSVATHPQRERIRAVIAEGAFSSYSRIAREKMNQLWLTWPLQYPLSWLFSDEFSAEEGIARLSPVPLLLIHGDADAVVPASHSRRLHAAAAEPRHLWIIPGGGHIDALTRQDYRQRLLEFLEALSLPIANGTATG